MKRVWKLVINITAGMLFLVSGIAHAEIAYKGFQIDESECAGIPQMDSMVARTKDQIDMVFGLGEPDDMIRFFQTLQIRLKSSPLSGGTPGLYVGNHMRDVEILPTITVTGHKPVLLHEMLHAYHDLKLEGGFMNSDILRYYLTAKSRHLFDVQSHMMSNQREFFACAATTYLFGVTAQEPFTREHLKQADPEFYAYLQSLFGPGTGTYTGWLSYLIERRGSKAISSLIGKPSFPTILLEPLQSEQPLREIENSGWDS